MLSICIPIYNNNCIELVNALHQQMQQFNVAIEIVCIDDKSSDEIRQQNKDIESVTTYVLLPQNIGRARIRNLFVQYAQHEYLLFLDNDAIIANENYLANYINFIQQNNYSVICGSSHFEKNNNSNNLSFVYNSKSEKAALLNPQTNGFTTNNFVIKKNVLQQIKFDESLVKYGHEDTLFGFDLAKNNIAICHINNPVTCIAKDDNLTFITKTKQAIDNLVTITQRLNYNPNFINEVTLLRTYFRLKKIGFVPVLKLVALMGTKPIEFILIKNYNSVKIYNLYKLLLLTQRFSTHS